MFDYVRCHYPLPDGKPNPEDDFQSKSTPAQSLDTYLIETDGTLWHEEYDIEDRSDPNAEGIKRFSGLATRVNPRWRRQRCFEGEIVFYELEAQDGGSLLWREFKATFVGGKVAQIKDLTRRISKHDAPVAGET